MKYIFDTDIGDDIDDAVALCAAVRGGLNLLGVTSVFLDTRRRCALARELLKEENSLRGCFVRCMLEQMAGAEDKELLQEAMFYGLQAFDGEVLFNDNP